MVPILVYLEVRTINSLISPGWIVVDDIQLFALNTDWRYKLSPYAIY